MKRRWVIALLGSLLLGGCSFGPSSQSSIEPASSQPAPQYFLQIAEVNMNYAFVGKDPLPYHCLVTRDGEDVSERVKNEVTWRSGDPTIATVQGGLVTALKEGDATIYAQYQGVQAEVELHSRVLAESFEIQSNLSIPLGEFCEIPYTISPANASVSFTSQDESTLKIEDNRFLPQKEGTAQAEAAVYLAMNEEGPSYQFQELHQRFTVEVTADRHPYFTLNQKQASDGEIIIAKNKYSSLDLPALGLAAFSYDGSSDLSAQMSVEGEYHLDRVGDYPLTVHVTDGIYASSFALLLAVEEYEIVPIEVETKDLRNVLSYDIEITTDANVYSTSFRKIGFRAKFTGINYDAYDLEIRIVVTVEASNDRGTIVSKALSADPCHLSHGQTENETERALEFMDGDWNYYLLATLNYEPNITISGKVYRYVYY